MAGMLYDSFVLFKEIMKAAFQRIINEPI